MATARSRGAQIRSTAFTYANLFPFVFFALFPFYFMFVTSFKSNAELYNLKSAPFWIQSGVIVDHYTYLFRKTDFLTWVFNSLVEGNVDFIWGNNRASLFENSEIRTLGDSRGTAGYTTGTTKRSRS